MRLGFAVKVLGAGGLPSHDTRRHASGPHLSVSLDRLEAILGYLEDNRRRPRARRRACQRRRHPPVDAPRPVHRPELGWHAAWIPPAPPPTCSTATSFVPGFDELSDAARNRLVVENDDRAFGLADVLALAERIGRPVVWDVLHHHCHDPAGIPDAEALALAAATWPAGVTPKVHFSSPRTAVETGRRGAVKLPPLRAHADLVDPIAFEHFLRHTVAGRDVDVMLEAKAKDLALLRLRGQLAARGLDPG
jgi:hypothetical protein